MRVITYNIAMNTKLEEKRTLLLTKNIKVSYNLLASDTALEPTAQVPPQILQASTQK
jgi:hypothetical protein